MRPLGKAPPIPGWAAKDPTNRRIMKIYQRLLFPFLFAFLFVFNISASLHGEDAVVALGAVASNGTLDNSANSVEGVVASSLNGTGT